jgi:ketosteroid isomerase-like protein
MSAEENKRLVRRFYEEIDKGNLDVIDELVAADYVDHNPPPFPGLSPGREGVKQAFKIFWEAIARPSQYRRPNCRRRQGCHAPYLLR